MNSYNLDSFNKGLENLGIELSEHQIEQFIQYYEILIEWNQVMNLTAITEFEEVIEKHFLDSLTIVKACNPSKIKTLLDVGTGAGFPGIPIKIVYPEIEVVLLDSLNKRIKFLDDVIDKLGLQKIKTIHGRAEDFARNAAYREQFEVVVSRAVANLSSLSEYCLPYVKTGGRFISYKSGKAQEELEQAKNAVFLLGGKLEDKVEFLLGESHRSFVIIKKVQKTSKKYPRKAGLPTKEPLN